MTSNYFTLRRLTEELSSPLLGSRFLEAYSHRPNELRLRFDRGTLVALLKPIDGALFLSSREEQRPRANTQSFFTELAGRELTAISIADSDRLVRLHFDGDLIELSYFGAPNAIHRNEREVVSTFKKHGEEVARTADASAQSLFGKKLQREVATRGGTPEELLRELKSGSGAYIFRRGDDVLLSPVELQSLAGWEGEHLDSINEAVRRVITERSRLARISGLRKEIVSRIQSEIDRLEKTRSDMRRGIENSDRSERFAAIGNALLMVAHTIEREAEEAFVEIEERMERVVLDPKLSAYENAAHYFTRSKSAKESKEELRVRSIELTEELRSLNELLARAVAADNIDDLLALQKRTVREVKAKNDDAPRFRQYEVAGGMLVLVGKNAKQNDELTMHVAKKEDLWLHARGVPGSHVVLQTGKRKNVPREAIEQAAEIAAFYSDARTQGLAPVSYIERKYVRKPKGAAPGAVKLEREEVIMVKPQVRGKEK